MSGLILKAPSAGAGAGFNYQLLTTGIDASLFNNTSGTSHSTWLTGQSGTFAQFMRVDYSGTNPDSGVNFTLPETTQLEAWVAWNRRHNGDTSKGCKELKIFGKPFGSGVNMTLIGPSYGAGLCVDYGDSPTGANDNGLTVFFGDTQAIWPAHGGVASSGRATPKPTIGTHLGDISTTDNLWHEYEIHYKKNSVSTQNGAIELKVDGVLQFSMTACWDNNDQDIGSGGGYIDNIGIGQYMPTGLAGVSRDYYNWRISYSGWMT